MKANYILPLSIFSLIISLSFGYPDHASALAAIVPSVTNTVAQTVAPTAAEAASRAETEAKRQKDSDDNDTRNRGSSDVTVQATTSIKATTGISGVLNTLFSKKGDDNDSRRQKRNSPRAVNPDNKPEPASTTISVYQQISQPAVAASSTAKAAVAPKPSAPRVGLRNSSLWSSFIQTSDSPSGYGTSSFPAEANASLGFGAFLSGITGILLASGKVAFKTFM